MATIYAKFNSGSGTFNVLDPNNWVGGVVPGENDIARFYYYQTIAGGSTFNGNASYEGLNYMFFSNTQYTTTDPAFNLNGPLYRSQFTASNGGGYTSSFWSGDYFRNLAGRLAVATASNGNAFPYGANSNPLKYQKGIYTNQLSLNTIGTAASYNKSSDNYWNNIYKDRLKLYSEAYGPSYYRARARTYYGTVLQGEQTSGFTFDGVTLSVTGNIEENLYVTSSRTFGVSKQQWADAGKPYTRMDRLFDLATGSALSVENGGRWKIYGPHNGRGRHVGNVLNYYHSITFWMVSESINSTPAMTSIQNGTQYDDSFHVRGKYNYMPGHQYPPYTEPNHFHADDGSLFIFQEASGSMKYASASINSNGDTVYNSDNSNHYNYFWSGSGNHIIIKDADHYSLGAGPGNAGTVKLLFDDFMYGSSVSNVRIDNTWCTWKPESKERSIIYNNTFLPESSSNNIFGGQLAINYNGYTETKMQKYELTGSQHWNVGRIEMSNLSHFHVKDQAKITLHDLGGANYPVIDVGSHWGGDNCTLLITDEVTIETSSSRTSLISTSETGIYHQKARTSILISGSANFSQSLSPSASSAGDNTIPITNLQDTFGIGDYISIESTGSVYTINPSENISTLFTGSEWNSGNYDTGSAELLRGRYTDTGLYSMKHHKFLSTGSSHTTQFKRSLFKFIERGYTNTVETDEIVQIVSMSGDYATVAKMYSQEGEIQSDMGLYSRNDFISTFTSGGIPDNYTGTKRVVLVDSNHLNFQKGDNLIISGSSYTVLHSTSYLSQSQFYEFTSSTQPPLEDVFDLEPAMFSGSSIWPATVGTYGITYPTPYYTETYKKDRLLITGSFKGSEFYQDIYKTSNAYNANRYGGSSGSSNGYRALRLDPTLMYGWRNWNGTSYYDYHSVESTHYMFGKYYLKDTYNFREGEIIVSGSLLRDGSFDPTSSEAVGYSPDNGFAVSWGEVSFHGNHNQGNGTHNGRYLYYDYNYPHPSGEKVSLLNYINGPEIIRGVYNRHANLPLSDGRRFNGSALSSGSFIINSNNNNPEAPYRYIYSPHRIPMQDDSTFPASIDFDSLWLSGSAMRNDATASINPGTAHIKIQIDDGEGKIFTGANGQEILFQKFWNEQGRGKVGIQINKHASIYSINIKTKWQQLILDTENSFDYRDRIKEGGLLYNHYPNHEIKHIASEVVDPKGFKNLLWEEEYSKGDTNLKPYMFANCYTGTTAGQPTNQNGHYRVTQQYGPGRALTPGPYITNYGLYNQYQNSDNFYIIYDLREQTQFDTVGMVFIDTTTYGYENDINNKMNNIRFEVTDDVGVDSPTWETVIATYDDTRINTAAGDIRFYTFPSGSVTKRFIKYHSRGGTSNAAYSQHSFFGLYNMSASCASSNTLTPAPLEDYTDSYGGPSASLCQVELGDAKNFKVGDLVYFWSKQMGAGAKMNKMSSGYLSYKNMHSATGYFNKTTPDEGFLGGVWNIHTITAKNGNIITLDKPITHNHIGVGTMCYKYNRGNITLKGDRPAPFMIYASSQNNHMSLQNVTFINGFARRDPLIYIYYPEFWVDIGMDLNQGNTYGYHQHGLFKNIVGNGPSTGGTSQNIWGVRHNTQRFNIMQTYSNQYIASSLNLGQISKYVENFNPNLAYTIHTTNNYGPNQYGSINPFGQMYIRNNFIAGGDAFSKEAFAAGGYLKQGKHLMANYKDYINVEGNVIAPYVTRQNMNAPNDINNINENQSQINTARSQKNAIKNQNIHWYFPSQTNPRSRPGVYAWHTTMNTRFSSLTQTQRQGSRFYSGAIYDNFQGKDFIFNRYSDSQAAFIVKSKNYDQDKLFDIWPWCQTSHNIFSSGQVSLVFNCTFLVKNQCDVRVDLGLTYIIDGMHIKYGNSDLVSYSNNKEYNQPGQNLPYITVINNTTTDVLYAKYLEEMTLTEFSDTNIYSLSPGTYSVNLHMNTFTSNITSHLMRFKNPQLKLVTNNLSDIVVHNSSWDCLKQFDSLEHYSNNNSSPTTSDAGKNRVLRQSSDLGGTTNYKFNKIKL